MKQLVILCIVVQAISAELESVMTLNHPDKNGYQSSVAGSDKHKYGYELKDNKHFHHTTTEKDGVRLGCYGYELEGKQYSTQYVADSHGYRIVSNQDLITVYPKSGGKRKASFRRDFDEDPSLSSNIRYFFPTGCKGIDVLIDNSSRLRAIAIPAPEVKPRLPVTMKVTTPDSYIYSTPPNSYIPPGPPNIYAPVPIPIQTARPPVVYLPPTETSTPANLYLPPTNVTEPPNVYLPPTNVTSIPENPTNIYLPPVTLPTTFRPIISQEIVPPEIPEDQCGNSLTCCDEASTGKFIIPIPLKSSKASGCCARVAKLILPVSGFDEDSIRKLTDSIAEEIDAKQLVKKILENLL